MNLARRALLAGAAAVLASPPRAWSAPAPHSVRDHGAKGDGRSNDTAAIQSAIASAAPGGTVLFPPGEYVSGTLRLRDRLVLRLAAGATLIASPDDEHFDPYEKLPYESFADRETSDFAFALLQGRGVQHVTILGPGRIDGNRRSRGGPKPIALKECRHVTIRDLTLENAPNYNISMLGCEHVDITGVTIKNGYADGIDPDCCRHVRISGCRVESRDDAICLKASLALGVRRPTEYVVVTGCELLDVRNGLKIGTESSGDFRNIVFRNCTMTGRAPAWNPIGARPFPSAGVSLQNVDGGTLEHVVVSKIGMKNVRAPFFVRLGARGWGQAEPKPGVLRRITIDDITATGADWASSITSVPGGEVSEIVLSNIRVSAKGGGAAALLTRPVPEQERDYPDAARFRNLPAYGLYCRRVAGLRVERATFKVDEPDPRPALLLDDVRDATVKGLAATAPSGGGPVVRLSGGDNAGVQVVD